MCIPDKEEGIEDMSMSNLVLFLVFLLGVCMFWIIVLTLPILIEAVVIFCKSMHKQEDSDIIMETIDDARAVSIVSIVGIIATVMVMSLNFFYHTDLIFVYTFVTYVITLVLSTLAVRKLQDMQADLVADANDYVMHSSLYAGLLPKNKRHKVGGFAEKEVEPTETKEEEEEPTETEEVGEKVETEEVSTETETEEVEEKPVETESTEAKVEEEPTEEEVVAEEEPTETVEVAETKTEEEPTETKVEEEEDVEKPEATEETPEEEVTEVIETEPETPEAEDFETVQK